MKFIYEYRTKDNVRHEDVICAPSRDAAFAALKSRGIRPGSVREAPGIFNKLFGKGKRWTLIAVLAAIVVALVCALNKAHVSAARQVAPLDDCARRQIIGDAAIIEKGIRSGWADVFADEGDRFLASFAIPGVPAGQRNTTEIELRRALAHDTPALQANASLEARQIVAIVNGMKSEIRELIKSGWTLREVGSALVKRQEREIGYYQQAVKEVERAKASKMQESDLLTLWEKKNVELRNMGIRLVPIPE